MISGTALYWYCLYLVGYMGQPVHVDKHILHNTRKHSLAPQIAYETLQGSQAVYQTPLFANETPQDSKLNSLFNTPHPFSNTCRAKHMGCNETPLDSYHPVQ